MPATPGAVLETFNATTLATQTINLPSYSAGDVIVITVANNPDGTAAIGTISSGPTGFTQVGTSVTTGAASDGRLSRWIKVMNGTEGSSVSMTTSTAMSIGAIARVWQGIDNATPQDVTAPAYSATQTSPNVTTVTDGAVVIRSILIDGAPGFSDAGIPSGHTLDGTIVQNPPSNGMNLGMAYEIVATAGSAGTAAWTGGGTEEAQSGTMVLRPLTNGVFSIDSDFGVGSDEFNIDEDSLDINGEGFEATQGTGAVYISDADTLAGSVNEVDVSSAINTWSDTVINLNLTTLSGAEIASLNTLGPGTRYIIVVNNSSDEYGSPALMMHRAVAFEMVLSGNFAPGSTTQRLTGLTGTFAGGRIEEALNPSATNTDVAADGNREDVWNIQAKPNARDVSYDFRVLYGGNVPDTITQTPQVTVTSVTIVTLSGTVQAQAAGITGAVERAVTLSGTVQAQAAGITGNATNFAVHTLSGTVQAQAAGVTGAVERAVTLSGTVQAQAAGIAGNVSNFAVHTLSGTVQAQAAGVTGAVERAVTLSGTAQAQAAGVVGSVTVVGNVTLSGTVQTQASTISGSVARRFRINPPVAFTEANFGGAIYTAGTEGGPVDQGVQANTIEDNNGTQAAARDAEITSPTILQWYAAQVFVKKDAIGKATRFPALGYFSTGVFTRNVSIAFDTSTGESLITNPGGLIEIVASVESYDADWWLVRLAVRDQDSNTTQIFSLYPAFGADPDLDNSSSAATGTITFAKLEVFDPGLPLSQAVGVTGNVTNSEAVTLSGTVQAQAAGVVGSVQRIVRVVSTDAADRFGNGDYSITLAQGDTAVLVLAVGFGVSDSEVAEISFGSEQATIIGAQQATNGSSRCYFGAGIFTEAQNPGVGAQTLTVNYSNGSQNACILVYEIYDASQNPANYVLDATADGTTLVDNETLSRTIAGYQDKAAIGFWAMGASSFGNHTVTFSGNLDTASGIADFNNTNIYAALDEHLDSGSLNFEFTVDLTAGSLTPAHHYGAVVIPVYEGPALFGTIQSQDAGVTGNITVGGTVTLSGTVQAQAAGITGAVKRAVTLSGSIQAQAAGITGAVERAVTVNANIIGAEKESDLTKWTIVGSPTVTANTVEDTSATVVEGLITNIYNYSISDDVIAVIGLEKDAVGRATRFPAFYVRFDGGAQEDNALAVDTSTGEGVWIFQESNQGNGFATAAIVDGGTQWIVVIYARSDNQTNTFSQIIIAPAFGASATWVGGVAAQGEITVNSVDVRRPSLEYLDSQQSAVTGAVTVAGNIALSGTVQAQAAGITGAVERAVTLSGTVQAQAAGITGAIERAVTLSGTVQAQAAGITGSVATAGNIALSGTVQAQAATVTGAVERAVVSSGTVQADNADITGSVATAGNIALSGTIQSQSPGITGVVDNFSVIALSGVAQAQGSNVNGAVERVITTSGTISAQSTNITGAVERVIEVSGTASSQNSDITGAVSAGGVHVLGGTITALGSAVSGAVTRSLDISGTLTSQSAGVTGSVKRELTITGVLTAQSALVNGVVERVITLDGTISAGVAGVTGAVERAITLTGILSSGASDLTGDIKKTVKLSGALSTLGASVSGQIKRENYLSGTVAAQSAGLSGNILTFPQGTPQELEAFDAAICVMLSTDMMITQTLTSDHTINQTDRFDVNLLQKDES